MPELTSLLTAPDAAAIVAAPLVRMAREDDIDGLLALTQAGGSGLTNLPPDRAALGAKLSSSAQALASAEAREAGAAILLMVEMDGAIVGTSCIFPRVGAEWPFYSYRLTRQVSHSRVVGIRKAQTVLNLVNDFDGETEVGGLFVDPRRRGHALGALAARARYLFIAAHREWFGRKVIAELRGYQDEAGRAPAWDAIGRHFYDMEFPDADRTGALAGNQFIADLGPRYPLYVSMLPDAAQAALGRPHNDGRPAFDMLLAEGFVAGDYVDIFDGGPTLVADIDAVRTVRDSRRTTIARIADGAGQMDAAEPSIVATGIGPDFRLARGPVTADGAIDVDLAALLDLRVGDTIHHLPI